MKLILRVLIILFLIFSNLISADLVDVPLKTFLLQVAKDKDITILLDKNIDDTITLTVSNKIRKGDYFNALKMVLEGKNLEIVKNGNLYYIQDIKKYRTIKLNFAKYDDVKNIIDSFHLKINYIKNSNSILVFSSLKKYKILFNIIKKIDIVPNQKKLKITIINTNLSNIREKGFKNDFHLKTGGNYFFNLLAYPYTVTNNLSSDLHSSFYSFIKFLNQQGYTRLLSSPTLTILDEKSTVFKIVNNIPYKVNSTQNLENQTTSSNYEYRDVGLNIKVIPKILSSNRVYMDLDISIENVINSTDTPSISKKRITQHLTIKQGDIYVLTGINQNEQISKQGGIPMLKDIPYLGWLFKYETKNKLSSNLTILLELVDDKIHLLKKGKEENDK